MCAGCCCHQDPRVGTEEECSSNRSEGGAPLLTPRATRAEDDLLYLMYLGDNESVLADVNNLVGEGSKPTLANAPNADILAKNIEGLRARI